MRAGCGEPAIRTRSLERLHHLCDPLRSSAILCDLCDKTSVNPRFPLGIPVAHGQTAIASIDGNVLMPTFCCLIYEFEHGVIATSVIG